MYMTPAFLERLAAGLGIPVQELPDINFYAVLLRHGAADWKAFASEASAIGHGQVFTSAGNTYDIRTAAASTQRGIRLEVVALVLFGILALLVTLLFVGQAVRDRLYSRRTALPPSGTVGRHPNPACRDRGDMRAAVLGLAGALIALLVAALSSQLLPVGLAGVKPRSSPGSPWTAAILVPGAFALAALICALALIPAWRVTRPTAVWGKPGGLGVGGTWVSGLVGRVAVPTTAGIGVRYGLEPGQRPQRCAGE